MRRSGVSAPLGRGVNFGNALDALPDGGRRLVLRDEYFDEVKAAGFDTVRLPVRWSEHARQEPPFSIVPEFFARVGRAVDQGVRRGLNVVVNVHHYHEINRAPDDHAERFVALWRQIAAHFAGRGDRLYFELLNEPRDALDAGRWNVLASRALAAIRESDPRRVVLVGSVAMNDVGALPELDLPADEHLMATAHYYAPFEFTHQGAPWVEGSARWRGAEWGGDSEREAVRRDLTRAASWARRKGVPLFIGEFGTYKEADPAPRVEWTAFVRRECERLGIGWAYWDFATDFGVYDCDSRAWRQDLLNALLSR